MESSREKGEISMKRLLSAMTALTLADLLLCNTVSTIDKIKKVYEED